MTKKKKKKPYSTKKEGTFLAIVHCKGVDNVFAMTFNYFCNCNYHIHELSFYFFTLITLCSFKFLYFNFKLYFFLYFSP
jgi:hypothetical protein